MKTIMEDDKKNSSINFFDYDCDYFIYLFIHFADAGESALIKKLPPGTAYAHFRKRSGATSNVIGKNKILILVTITSYYQRVETKF